MSVPGQVFQGDDGQYYAAYCPGAAGSVYYLLACITNNGFLGCCTNQKGCYNECDASDYSNFSISAYRTHVAQSFNSNIQSQRCDVGGTWYSCAEENLATNFIGCCTTNPCTAGCPDGNYTRAFLAADVNAAKFFYGLNDSSMSFSMPYTTTTSTSAQSSGSTTIPFPSSLEFTSGTTSSSSMTNPSSTTSQSSISSPSIPYATSTSGPQAAETAYTPGTSVVVGSTVGGVATLILIIALIAYHVRRKATSRRRHLDASRVSSLWGDREEGGGEGKTEHEGAGDVIAEAPPSAQMQEPKDSDGKCEPPPFCPPSRIYNVLEEGRMLLLIMISPSEIDLPPTSSPKLSTSKYTAYSRPFSELDAAFNTQQQQSSPPRTQTEPSSPSSLERGSLAGEHQPHPYPLPGGYSDGMGQAI